ncbi:Hypothetical protein NTJ_02646 [Nesidiocoris tenuis]|uniref:Uncharacterized protein n=1 Tax=Nesidiocoris tenuis TaxID=355587 RepID=A0ABN7AEQ2_9HEMI|nr:Hypothetical protein NTJ_02646 [Nesidiocoris tenuis]
MDWLDLESLEALLQDSEEIALTPSNAQISRADGHEETSPNSPVASRKQNKIQPNVFHPDDHHAGLGDSSTIPGSKFPVVALEPDLRQTICSLKEKLIAGNAEEKLSALESALHITKRSHNAKETFVDANFIESAIETFGSSENEHVVRAAFVLIKELIQCPRFTSGTSGCLLILSLMRVAAEASWTVDKRPITEHGLQLTTETIIIMKGAHQKLDSFCCVEQLATSGKIILDNLDGDKSVLMSMFHLVHKITTLYEGVFSCHGQVEKTPFVYLAHNTYVSLWRTANALNDFDVDLALCQLGLAFLEKILAKNEDQASLNEQFRALLNASASNRIVPLLARQVPVSFKSEVPKCQRGGEFDLDGILNILTFVSAYYKHCSSKLQFTAVLEENQILFSLPVIDQMCKTGEQHLQVRSLLVEFMAHLATKKLGPGYDWLELLTDELQSIPPNLGLTETLFPLSPTAGQASESKSTNSHPVESSKGGLGNVSSFVFRYLLLVNDQTAGVQLELFSRLCSYFHSLVSVLPGKEKKMIMNASIFKAVWLCYAVGYYQHRDVIDYHLRVVNETVINAVSSYHLDEIYTHHPAILNWTFNSGRTKEEICAQLMTLWLNTEDGTMSETFKQLLSSSRNAINTYLKLLTERCKDRTSMAAHLSEFPAVLLRCDPAYRDAIASDAWILLPKALVEASNRHQHFGTVPLLIICQEFAPALLDQDLLLMIASTIPAAIDNRDQDSLMDVFKNLAVFKFINRLIERVNESYETVILTSFLNNKGFILAMERALSLHDDKLTITVLDLLAALLTFQRKQTASSQMTIKQTCSELLKLLSNSSPDLKMAALRVVHLMMPDDDVLSQVVPVIEMGMMSYDDLAKIYYRIHTNASRIVFVEDDHVLVWDCMSRILKYLASKDSKLGVRLAHYRHTHDLIRTAAQDKSRSDARTSAMFRFVRQWAKFHKRSSPRALRPTLFDETMNLLATVDDSTTVIDSRSTNLQVCH